MLVPMRRIECVAVVSLALACVEPKSAGMMETGAGTDEAADGSSDSSDTEGTSTESSTGSTEETGTEESTTADDSSAYETGDGCTDIAPCEVIWADAEGKYPIGASWPNGHYTVPPNDLDCPPGTVEFDSYCSFTVAPCACHFVCPEACGPREVCVPVEKQDGTGSVGDHCECHGAFEGEPGACEWSDDNFLENPDFVDCEGWKFFGDDGTAPYPVKVEVLDEQLHLEAGRCQEARAVARARIPDAAAFPEGAALVFRYRFEAAEVLGQSTVSFGLWPLAGQSLEETGPEMVEHRVCLDLNEIGIIGSLRFEMEGLGLCASPLTMDLTVDDIRLEADPACG